MKKPSKKTKAKSSPGNALQIIFPYKDRGQWMFDDERAGLVREPFVYGMDTLLNIIATREKIKGLSKGVKLIFSHLPFPQSIELVWDREDVGGNWYVCPEINNHQGWLCPALFKYFKKAPPRIYVKMFPLAADEAENIHAAPSHKNSILGTKAGQAIRNWRDYHFCIGLRS